MEPKKDYFILLDNITANRITAFHNFCKEIPKVMCNYCSITLYPEEISKAKNGAPDACRASTANAHVPGIEVYTGRLKRTRGGRQEDAFCSSHATATRREKWVLPQTSGAEGDCTPQDALLHV